MPVNVAKELVPKSDILRLSDYVLINVLSTSVSIYVSLSVANLFLLISSILGSKTAGPQTQFVQSFVEERVECSEQGSRGSILQFMPFTMVREPHVTDTETQECVGCWKNKVAQFFSRQRACRMCFFVVLLK